MELILHLTSPPKVQVSKCKRVEPTPGPSAHGSPHGVGSRSGPGVNSQVPRGVHEPAVGCVALRGTHAPAVRMALSVEQTEQKELLPERIRGTIQR
jgi:hypothetical protein